MPVLCVLPARLRSERIPEKPLQEIAGRPLVEWGWRAASRVPGFDEVWVATDAEEVAAAVRGFGGRAVLTDPGHASGTDRVAEVAASPAAQGFDIVVNFQADELFVPPAPVERAVAAVRAGRAPVATLAAPIRSEAEWRAEGVVKVVRGSGGRALYFSRAPVPHPRGGTPDLGEGADPVFLRHVGVYAFSREGLARWVALGPSRVEAVERLEQLRALEGGLPIHVVVGPPAEPGVDEPGDLERAARILREPSGANRGTGRERESHV